MNDTQDSLPDPFDIAGWRARAAKKAELAGFPDDKKEGDAFRHIYTALINRFDILQCEGTEHKNAEHQSDV